MSQALILFDCDGTLVDSHAQIIHAMQLAFADAGLQSPSFEAVRGIIGHSIQSALQALQAEPEHWTLLTQAYAQHYRALEHEVCLYEGIVELLQCLQQTGVWMGIVTGKSSAGLQRVLAKLDLADFFMVQRTADVCPSKPHPAMTLECMQELGVAAEQTVVIGDAVVDMQMARAAAVHALGVCQAGTSELVLRQAGAHDVRLYTVDMLPVLAERLSLKGL